jgi:hypothetical protein
LVGAGSNGKAGGNESSPILSLAPPPDTACEAYGVVYVSQSLAQVIHNDDGLSCHLGTMRHLLEIRMHQETWARRRNDP